MKKQKGFTLIELLAVIIILAVIALIAVPKVFDIIEDSRQGIYETDIEVFQSVNENTIQINLTYSIPNTGINDTLELNFN
jgi:type IV pilus assembly protein PilA